MQASDTPAQKHGTHGKARTYGREKHRVALLQLSAIDRVVQRKRNRPAVVLP